MGLSGGLAKRIWLSYRVRCVVGVATARVVLPRCYLERTRPRFTLSRPQVSRDKRIFLTSGIPVSSGGRSLAAAPPLCRGHSETQKPRSCGGPGLLTLDGERLCTSHRSHGPKLSPSMWLGREKGTGPQLGPLRRVGGVSKPRRRDHPMPGPRLRRISPRTSRAVRLRGSPAHGESRWLEVARLDAVCDVARHDDPELQTEQQGKEKRPVSRGLSNASPSTMMSGHHPLGPASHTARMGASVTS